TNQLIKDGARMVTSAADVLEELLGVGIGAGLIRRSNSAGADAPRPATGSPGPPLLDSEEERVLRAIGSESVYVDVVAGAAGLDPAAASAKLLEMELRGLVRSMPGMRYCRAGRS
ncbi:MAG TPA: hypothetical protein VMN39_00545, partial [Longimicrobiaceae bacterium]|nr:hypothetical protein [Longimicrobiaceae bacterium]